jgi:hypothetical protein
MMTSEDNTIWDKLQTIPREVLYLLVIISMIIPLLSPLGLPIPISPQTRTLYDSLDTLQPGDVFVQFVDYSAGSMSFHEPGFIAITYKAVNKGAKLVMLSSSVEGPMMYEIVINKIKPFLDSAGYVYGEDYVYLGYTAGEETALAAIASNIRSVYTTDQYGTPLDDITLMQSVNNHEDFTMLISYTMGSPESFVRQFNTQYGVTTHIHCGEMMTPTILPFWASGQITGLLNGGVGAAEMEVLVDRPGDAVKLTDVYSFSNLIVFAFLIIGNIGFIMKGRMKE